MIKPYTKNRSQRAGITLLFVISMIVLFLLMGASFVLMTTQFRKSSVERSRIETRRDDANTLVTRAFRDLLRGPSLDDVYSPLRGHSLLGDQYGFGAKAFVTVAESVAGTNNQFIAIQLDSAVGVGGSPNIAGQQFYNILSPDGNFSNPVNHFDFSNQGGAYDGMVLTFTSGPASGVSTRIVSYAVQFDSTGAIVGRRFFLMPQWNDQGGAFDAPTIAQLATSASEVVINGRAFSGTGAGIYNPLVDEDNAALSTQALFPNWSNQSRANLVNNYLAINDGGVLGPHSASTNEDYDAVDFQNMFLAAIRNEDGDGSIDPWAPGAGASGIIPSFHRPALIRYHRTNTAGAPEDTYSFRVTQAVRGNGDFPTADALDAPEVDNDGDGINDGVWLDIGLPIQTDMRGRVFKPLVSFLVIDMDGKLNVNAHGNLTHLDPNTGGAFVAQRIPLLGSVAGGVDVANPFRGQGYGPPEINLASVFPFGPGSDLQMLMTGVAAGPGVPADIPGRYGFDGTPGVDDPFVDAFMQNKWNGHPVDSIPNGGLLSTLGAPTLFGSPLDHQGRFGIGFPDFFRTNLLSNPYDAGSPTFDVPIGMPVMDVLVSNWSATLGRGDEFNNSAYEMSFRRESAITASGGAIDTPFTPREMERVLRRYDSDSIMLPARLREFTNATLGAESARLAFTTDSYEVPVPPTHLVNDLRQLLIDMNGLTVDASGNMSDADEAFVNQNVFTMLSPDIVKGLKMDPNRPFGNGRDDNGDGVVDNYWHSADPAINEALSAQPLPQANSIVSLANTGFDTDNDGVYVNDPDAHLAHQVFARHLYVMTLLTTQYVDRNGDGVVDAADWYDYDPTDFDYNGDGVGNGLDDVLAYRVDVAQWAINVANFRDRDATMQPFEYDLNPWDGWDVNHILDDDTLPGGRVENPALTRVAWGVERPEMVISETLANHDRRTEDRDDDNGANPDFSVAQGGADPTTDSRLVPNASVFLEFYNPWISSSNNVVNGNNQAYPPEIYDAGGNGIDLQRLSLDGSSPVWQVMVIKTDPANLDANPDNNEVMESNILRRVYFVQPDSTVDAVQYGTNKVYFPDSALNFPPLVPGQYAVAGSAGIQNGDRYHTYLGRRMTPTWDMELEDQSDETRRITLDTNNNAVEVNYFDGMNWQVLLPRPAVAIPIGFQFDPTNPGTPKLRSLGVTDPVAGYDVAVQPNGLLLSPVADGFELVDAAMMPITRDVPLDADFSVPGEWAALQDDGLHNDDQLLRVVHLRRLANPMAPYDPVLNPYLTVDSLGMPVNVFNGASNDDEPGAPMTAVADFTTRERGANDATATPPFEPIPRDRLFWRADQSGLHPSLVAADTPVAGDMHFHPYELGNSLGEIDVAYRNGSVNAFPWLTWNNRPFVSHLELANVPFTSSYRLLSRADYQPGGFDNYNLYANATGNPNRDVIAGRFRHLLGFHADEDESPRLFRVMDYLEVPSRFIGTETYLNPAHFAQLNNGLGFNPPFNWVSHYRYPGKINMNTVFDQRVWNGVVQTYVGQMPYSKLRESREGNNVNMPTEFASPFRSGKSANLVPEAPFTFGGSRHRLVADDSADTGMFRRDPIVTDEAMFDIRVSQGAHADPERNAYFRYDLRQKLGNLVTNKSSVFSIWITIGFFEVDEDLRIGAEVGSDTGQVNRYRGFFMVDRSIPVAFEPGVNHNVDESILTSSIIERSVTVD